MAKILRTLRNYICYCGIEKEEYNAVKKDAYVSNFEIWRFLLVLMSVAFAALFIYSVVSPFAQNNRWFYLGTFVYATIAAVVFFLFKKKDSILGQFIIYLSVLVLLGTGCLIASNKPDTPATTFIALLLVAPMFVISKPYIMITEIICADAFYLIWMSFVKEPAVFKMDFVNIIAFSAVSMITLVIACSIRIKEFILIRKINIQKDIDELTGLKNKAALTREIGNFVEASNTNKGLFFVLDINFFKQINDTYGHDVGDIILTELGKYFSSKFVSGEIVGRFGGDEFIIFIKDHDEAEYAKQVALEISHDVEAVVTLPDPNKTVSVSIGVAIYHGEEKHYSDIFKKADVALYKTKEDRSVRYSIYQQN